MWILVVGGKAALERADSGAAVLGQLGCRVRTADLWDAFDEEALHKDPPTAVLIEAQDEVDAGRAALTRLRAVPGLLEVPMLLAVSVSGLTRLDVRDGYDDIVLVPYVPQELYVRIRRAEWRSSDFADSERVKLGRMEIDLAAHEVSVGGVPVELTHQEFALLRFFCQNRGRVFTREHLLQRVWGVDYYGSSRTVDIHIRRLRAKIGDEVLPIETVRGSGYKLKVP